MALATHAPGFQDVNRERHHDLNDAVKRVISGMPAAQRAPYENRHCTGYQPVAQFARCIPGPKVFLQVVEIVWENGNATVANHLLRLLQSIVGMESDRDCIDGEASGRRGVARDRRALHTANA